MGSSEKSIVAVGFSNGDFLIGYLTGNLKVSAGIYHYSV